MKTLKMTDGKHVVEIKKLRGGGSIITKYDKKGNEIVSNRLVNSIEQVESIYIKKGWKKYD